MAELLSGVVNNFHCSSDRWPLFLSKIRVQDFSQHQKDRVGFKEARSVQSVGQIFQFSFPSVTVVLSHNALVWFGLFYFLFCFSFLFVLL